MQVCPVDDWRCTPLEGGGLSVMIGLDKLRLMLLVSNWDTPMLTVLITQVHPGKRRFILTLNQLLILSCGHIL